MDLADPSIHEVEPQRARPGVPCNIQQAVLVSSRTEGTYSKYSSIDDRIDMFHYYTTLVKFGIGRSTYDAAQEIRNNKITREEGSQLVKKFDEEFPKKYFKEFLDYISLSEVEFHETIDKFRSPHLWEKIDDEWVLKRAVWHDQQRLD